MALHSSFSDYLFLYKKQPHCLFCGNAVLDGTDGHPLAPVAGPVRKGELGLSPLVPLVQPGRLAAPDMAYLQPIRICPPRC